VVGEQERLGGLQHVEVVRRALRLALDVNERVCRDLPDALCALVDGLAVPAQLVDGVRAQALGQQLDAPPVGELDRQRFER
jgi:hypothetical protein